MYPFFLIRERSASAVVVLMDRGVDEDIGSEMYDGELPGLPPGIVSEKNWVASSATVYE